MQAYRIARKSAPASFVEETNVFLMALSTQWCSLQVIHVLIARPVFYFIILFLT